MEIAGPPLLSEANWMFLLHLSPERSIFLPVNNLHRCLVGTPVRVKLLSCGSQLQGDAIDSKMLKLQSAHNWRKGKGKEENPQVYL